MITRLLLHRYKTRSHVMLKKKEEELRRAIAAAPQAEGALQKALSQVIDIMPINCASMCARACVCVCVCACVCRTDKLSTSVKVPPY
eukprot:COSAG02_NODE_591_length_19862_cov_8.047918_5_plen_87_part_00